jgi:hypothetical protein
MIAPNAETARFLRAFLTLHLDTMPEAMGSGVELFEKPVWVLASVCPRMTLQDAATYLHTLADSVMAERLR